MKRYAEGGCGASVMIHEVTRNNIVCYCKVFMKLQYAVMWTVIPHSSRKTQPCGLCEPLRQQSLLLSPSQMPEVGGGPSTLDMHISLLTLLSNSTNGPSARDKSVLPPIIYLDQVEHSLSLTEMAFLRVEWSIQRWGKHWLSVGYNEPCRHK